MVTIKDIARELNLSHSVVSRALNPNPDKNARVSKDTKQLVEATARELGYQPNRIAEFMKRGRSAAIGVFLPEYSNRLIADLVVGISLTANKYGFPLNFFFGLNYDSYASFINSNIKNPSSGIISYPYKIEGSKNIDKLFKTYLSAGGKAILLNTGQQQIAPVLYMDEAHGGRCAAECLEARNCKHYLVAKGFTPRVVACKESLREKGIVCVEFEQANFERVIMELAGAGDFPLGIFAPTDEIALSLMKKVNKTEFRLGHDILIVGYDDLQLTAMIDPPLTTVHQPFKTQGIRAVEKLVNTFYGKVEEDEAVKPYLVRRETA